MRKSVLLFAFVLFLAFCCVSCDPGVGEFWLRDDCLVFTSDWPFSITPSYSGTNANWDGILQYLVVDGKNVEWVDFSKTSVESASSINCKDNKYRLCIRGLDNTIMTGSSESSVRWLYSGYSLSCTGNIMTLLDGDDPSSATMGEWCFSRMFYEWHDLQHGPDLPATTLSKGCYHYLFFNCSLVEAMDLPALVVPDNAYEELFSFCDFTEPPQIAATVLGSSSCQGMFRYSKITSTPVFHVTQMGGNCFDSAFEYCTGLTEATVPNVLDLSESSLCYWEMFQGCTALVTAPELPATTLGYSCYHGMFQGCTALKKAPQLPNTGLIADCYTDMFYGCSSLMLESVAGGSSPTHQNASLIVSATSAFNTNTCTDMFKNCGTSVGLTSGYSYYCY